MNFKAFIDLYDNWNGILVVNDNNLDEIVQGDVCTVVDTRPDLHDIDVISFGFYDDELTVRLRCYKEES